MAKRKRVIFISHAYEDRALIAPLQDKILGKFLRKSRYDIFYTSDTNDPSIKAGEDIWPTILKQLRRCDLFVAFCSPSYFKMLAHEIGLKPTRLGSGDLVWSDAEVQQVRRLREQRSRNSGK